MATNDPKDTRQRQSLTGTLSQQPDIEGLKSVVQQQTGPQNTVQQALSKPATSPFQSSVLERRKQRLAAQPPPETPDVTPEAGLTAPPTAPTDVAPVDPGLMITTATQETEKPLSEEYQKAASKAMNASAELETAQRDMIEAQQQDLQKEAEIKAAQAAQETAQAQMLQQRVDANIAAQQEAMDRYQQDYDKYASMEVQNPWARASTGSKVLAGLSIVLGGLSGPGGAESARKVIDDAIARDIELQKANLNKKKGDLTMLQQHAKDLQNMNMSDVNITKSMQALANGAVARQLESMAATTAASNPARSQLMAQMANERRQAEFALQRQVAADQARTVTTKQVPFATAMQGEAKKPLDGPRLKNLESAEGSIKAYAGIKNMLKDPEFRDKVGKIAGNWNRFKAAWLGDAKAASLMSATDRALLSALREATGAQMTDAERQFISQTMPSFTENIESFEAKLEDRYKESLNKYETLKNRYSRNFDTGGFLPLEEVAGYVPQSARKREE